MCKNGVRLSGNITFANLSDPCGTYAANVNLNYLLDKWIVVLNDGYSKNLHVFEIPSNTFKKSDFYIRADKNLIVLIFDTVFCDNHPRLNIYNDFSKYKIKTIDYK